MLINYELSESVRVEKLQLRASFNRRAARIPKFSRRRFALSSGSNGSNRRRIEALADTDRIQTVKSDLRSGVDNL